MSCGCRVATPAVSSLLGPPTTPPAPGHHPCRAHHGDRYQRQRAVLAGCSIGWSAVPLALPLASALYGATGVVAAAVAAAANAVATQVGGRTVASLPVPPAGCAAARPGLAGVCAPPAGGARSPAGGRGLWIACWRLASPRAGAARVQRLPLACGDQCAVPACAVPLSCRWGRTCCLHPPARPSQRRLSTKTAACTAGSGAA